ncbi:MAG: hypothetical protein NWE89_12700 [Candidatus Bathyarchaeota archaeon]|nr:hypothetical protein [Candidatus Bathyarchaeota archaeon]
MSYLFYCTNKTTDECLEKGLFGNSKQHWDKVKKIKIGDPVFLYNLSTGCLIGPFRASSRPKIHLDPYAFLKKGNFPAQVEVTWTLIGEIKAAHKILPFLSRQLKCRLTPTETVKVLQALHEVMGRKVYSWL